MPEITERERQIIQHLISEPLLNLSSALSNYRRPTNESNQEVLNTLERLFGNSRNLNNGEPSPQEPLASSSYEKQQLVRWKKLLANIFSGNIDFFMKKVFNRKDSFVNRENFNAISEDLHKIIKEKVWHNLTLCHNFFVNNELWFTEERRPDFLNPPSQKPAPSKPRP